LATDALSKFNGNLPVMIKKIVKIMQIDEVVLEFLGMYGSEVYLFF